MLDLKIDDSCVVVENGKCYFGKVIDILHDEKRTFAVRFKHRGFWFYEDGTSITDKVTLYTVPNFIDKFDLPELKVGDIVTYVCNECYTSGSRVSILNGEPIRIIVNGVSHTVNSRTYQISRSSNSFVLPLDGTKVKLKTPKLSKGDVVRLCHGKDSALVHINSVTSMNGELRYGIRHISYTRIPHTLMICANDTYDENLQSVQREGVYLEVVQFNNLEQEFQKHISESYQNSDKVQISEEQISEEKFKPKEDDSMTELDQLKSQIAAVAAGKVTEAATTVDSLFPSNPLTSHKENNMRVVQIELFDKNPGILEANDRIVAIFKDVATTDDDATTIQELIMNEDVAAKLAAHNEKRAKMVNQDILNRTGQEVMLAPVRLKDLTWNVK